MQGETRKKSSLNEQKNSNRKNSSKQHNKLGITGPCSPSTFFQGKELFYWIRVWSDNAEDDNKLLQKWLGEPFYCTLHCPERTEFFRSNFLFHGKKTFNTCIELGIVPLPLGSNWLWWILHWTRVIFETTNPLNISKVRLRMQWQFFCSHFKAEEKCLFPMIKQQLNLTNQNSEFISSIIQYEEKPELINAVYKVFISNSILILWWRRGRMSSFPDT